MSNYIEPWLVNTFSYCPRRWYYQHVLGIFIRNDHVEVGRYVHEQRHESAIDKRSEVFIVSHRWKMKGKVDFIRAEENTYVPVEVKKSKDKFGVPVHNDIMQLVCYAIMLEERYETTVTTGELIYAGSRKKYTISIQNYHKMQLQRLVTRMRAMKNLPEIPRRIKNKNRCWNCSINSYCLENSTG